MIIISYDRLFFRTSYFLLERFPSKTTVSPGPAHSPADEEADATFEEYSKQKEYLEKSVYALKVKLRKDSEIHKQDNQRAMLENMSLIKNINELRREIGLLKHEQQLRKLNQQGM